MYIFIYIYINAYLNIYSPHNKFKTCQPNTNFSQQKSFTRPVHRSPSHLLAFSADLVGSTHLWVTLAVSKTVGNRLSADKGEGFRGHWGAVNHNQTMEKCDGKVLQLGQDFSLLLTLWFHVSNRHPSEQQATPRFPPPFSCSVKGVWQAAPFQ